MKVELDTIIEMVEERIEIVRLELDVEEAHFLADLLRYVGGSPFSSRRYLADDMRANLSNAGIHDLYDRGDKVDMAGSIICQDLPEDEE